MADEFSIFGQLTGLTPSGKPKDAKEVPVDKDSRRKRKGKKRKRPEGAPGEELAQDLEGQEKSEAERKASGKVVDILI
jgi:hypothetical protein